ncbi:N-(5'-phosphoribosyl)anthranilate isomerase [Streptomyces sp. ST2-7A]|uniref:phosphoribosylanthranilate isomerase n=1 Tax=Streptomyces sp. ST2-7A TaxID=2907214 RepID=UPI001F227F68|nr:N-(5'-phosphoribosyl)anthranilate isomerase [Streptomyces sp. ST2-7A]MCE7081109.1 N-(5'-phosphoribosyl)anthranilate isomerase [Streptomyces sp. ST2-7A]
MTAPLLKACGATTEAEITGLAAAGADLVGLWHGIPGGRAELDPARLRQLAAATARTGTEPVVVTLHREAEPLLRMLRACGTSRVQLHGYQPPSLVRALARAGGVTVLKVLHLHGGGCPEQALIPAYERAGTDCFVLDSATADGRIGSTGVPADPALVLRLADLLNRPFLLAGGIRADSRPAFAAVAEHPRFLGIDVDTAARDTAGSLSGARLAAIAHGWRTGQPSERTP